MGEWSEECYCCDWHEGFDAPVVGATFDGHNRHGDHEWTTQGRVIEADPGRAFAFECSMMDFHYSTWGYRIEPTETGCKVTEWSEDVSDNCKGVGVDAFLWRQGHLVNLNTLITAPHVHLTQGLNINDSGEILALGTAPNGNQHVYVLVRSS